MFVELGRKIMRFVLIYSIIDTIILSLLLAYNLPVPDSISFIPISPDKLRDYVTSIGQSGSSVLGFFASIVGVAFANFFFGVAGGIAILFYKLSSITNNPGIMAGMTTLGIILQASVHAYAIHMILAWVRGTGE